MATATARRSQGRPRRSPLKSSLRRSPFRERFRRVTLRFRSPKIYWTAALALAILTASASARFIESARESAERLEIGGAYVVASRRLTAGSVLSSADVELVALPQAIVPQSAISELPLGQRIRVDLDANEPLTGKDLASEESSAISARIDQGETALAIPAGPSSPRLSVGDRVDVISITPEAQGSVLISTSSEVIEVTEDFVMIGIPRAKQTQVAEGIAAGVIQLALRPPG